MVKWQCDRLDVNMPEEIEHFDSNSKSAIDAFETVEPVGKRVLIRKDEDKKETKGGIRLPDNIEIPTITGRVVAVSAEIASDPVVPLKRYDKVLFNPKNAIPVDFEGDNRLFVIDLENVVAVFRRNP
jgi:chaperonin GroES